MEQEEETKPDNFKKCSHIQKDQYKMHGAIILDIDDISMLLCRACYGDIVMQVLNNLKTIKVKI